MFTQCYIITICTSISLIGIHPCIPDEYIKPLITGYATVHKHSCIYILYVCDYMLPINTPDSDDLFRSYMCIPSVPYYISTSVHVICRSHANQHLTRMSFTIIKRTGTASLSFIIYAYIIHASANLTN